MTNDFAERVYSAVKRIPRGRVASYADIALLAGAGPGAARAVGQVLKRLGPLEEDVPWWRVVHRSGELPTVNPEVDMICELRLVTEGVRRSPDSGKISWEKHGCLLPPHSTA